MCAGRGQRDDDDSKGTEEPDNCQAEREVKMVYLGAGGSTVIQCNSYAKIVLGKNAVIGISEGDRYLCDYVATEDSVLAVFNCESAEDLKEAIHGQESMRSILLRAALGQRQMLLRTLCRFYQSGKAVSLLCRE